MPTQPGEVHQQRQHRHDQGRRQHPRQHQPGDRVDAHDAERVDLLVHPHGAELRREGRAGAPGQHHRRHQRAELPQQRDADQVRDVVLAPEPAQRHRGLEGEDQSDQEAEQHGQPEGAQPRLVQVPHDLAEAQAPGPADQAGARHQRLAEKGDLVEHPVAAPEGRAAEAAEPGQRVARPDGGSGRFQRAAGPLQHGPLRPLGSQPLPPRRPARLALQPEQQHGAGGVEGGDAVEIEGERLGAPGAAGRLRPEPRHRAGIERAAEGETDAARLLRPRLHALPSLPCRSRLVP